jgi:hypothetical protein
LEDEDSRAGRDTPQRFERIGAVNHFCEIEKKARSERNLDAVAVLKFIPPAGEAGCIIRFFEEF